MGFVDNKKDIEYYQPYPMRLLYPICSLVVKNIVERLMRLKKNGQYLSDSYLPPLAPCWL